MAECLDCGADRKSLCECVVILQCSTCDKKFSRLKNVYERALLKHSTRFSDYKPMCHSKCKGFKDKMRHIPWASRPKDHYFTRIDIN